MFEAKNIEQHYSLEERLFLEKVRGFCQLVEDRYSPYLTDFLNPLTFSKKRRSSNE